MGLRRILRTTVVEKLPRRYRFSIERAYGEYCNPSSHLSGDVAVLHHLCDPNKAALDIGASFGSITLYLCKYASYVYCFEPLPTVADHLRHRFAGCNVSVENIALGNIEGELPLNIPCIKDRIFEGWSSLIKDFDNDVIRGEKVTRVERVKVKVRRLDSYNLNNIGLIKIDVEGFELEVLRGGEDTIKREMPNLFIEIEKRHHKEGNIFDVFHCLSKWGYGAYFVKGKKLIRMEEFDFDKMQSIEIENTKGFINDFVFIPNPVLPAVL